MNVNTFFLKGIHIRLNMERRVIPHSVGKCHEVTKGLGTCQVRRSLQCFVDIFSVRHGLIWHQPLRSLLFLGQLTLAEAVLFDVDTFEDYLTADYLEAYLLIEAYTYIKCQQVGSLSEPVEEFSQPFEKFPCIASATGGHCCSYLTDEDCAANVEYRRSCCRATIGENSAYAVTGAVRCISVPQ